MHDGRHDRVTLRNPCTSAAVLVLSALTLAWGIPVAHAEEAHAHEDDALGEIVVTTTRIPRRLADEPTRIEVVNAHELEEKVAMNAADVTTLLNETAGLRVQTTSAGLGSANVRIQGLRGRYSQVLADGLPLYGGQTGGTGLLQIPPVDLGQVEILKGSASALYGASALGGVINFVSRRPDGRHELLLNQTHKGGTDAALWWSGPVDEDPLKYSVVTSLHRQTSQDVDDDGWADMARFERVVVRPRVHWDDGEGNELFVTAGAMLEDREGGTVKGGVVPIGSPSGTPFEEALRTRRFDVGTTARRRLSDVRSLSMRASYTHRDATQVFGDVREPSRFDTALAEATYGGESGAHSWLVGLVFQQERYRNDTFPAFDFTYDVPGVFAHDEIRACEHVTVSASARVDRHDEFGTFFSPRVSVLWKPGEDGAWRVRASAGGGFFGPTPLTEDTEATGLARVVPATGLRAERARGGSVDLTREWGLDDGTLEANLTVFGSRLTEAVYFVAVPGTTDRFTFENAAEAARTLGTEFSLRLHAGGLHAVFSHVYLDSSEQPPDATTRRAVPLNPKHSAGFVVAWEMEHGRIGLEGAWSGRQPLDENPYRTESPGFVTFGFLVQRRFGPLTAFLNFENFTDRRVTRTHPLVLPARAADGRWTTDAWGPLDGRVINGGFRWSFGGEDEH
jgi:iron complex outermembrane receptor protein